jgi:hypothetical protein
MSDPGRHGPAADTAPKVRGKRFREHMARLLADMAGRLEKSYADLKNTAGIRRQLMTVPGIGPIIASAMVAAIGNGAAFAKGAILPPGSASCRSRCPQVIGRSSAALQSVAIAICARCSCRALASFCSDRPIGKNIALDLGSRLQPSACITMFWQPRSPTSWRGSPGRSWRRAAATNGAQCRDRLRPAATAARRTDKVKNTRRVCVSD